MEKRKWVSTSLSCDQAISTCASGRVHNIQQLHDHSAVVGDGDVLALIDQLADELGLALQCIGSSLMMMMLSCCTIHMEISHCDSTKHVPASIIIHPCT
jgi:hypothetical protein